MLPIIHPTRLEVPFFLNKSAGGQTYFLTKALVGVDEALSEVVLMLDLEAGVTWLKNSTASKFMNS